MIWFTEYADIKTETDKLTETGRQTNRKEWTNKQNKHDKIEKEAYIQYSLTLLYLLCCIVLVNEGKYAGPVHTLIAINPDPSSINTAEQCRRSADHT